MVLRLTERQAAVLAEELRTKPANTVALHQDRPYGPLRIEVSGFLGTAVVLVPDNLADPVVRGV
jgi:hypothetical protein